VPIYKYVPIRISRSTQDFLPRANQITLFFNEGSRVGLTGDDYFSKGGLEMLHSSRRWEFMSCRVLSVRICDEKL
jgi:hypothetical protein